MTDEQRRAEREELIVGDRAGSLDPDEVADVALLAELLGDPSTWAEPGAGLEDAVVQAVAAAEPSARARRQRRVRWRPIVLSAAAAVVVLAAVGAVLLRGAAHPDFEGELTGTELALGAAGSVEIERNPAGFEITIDASGLPELRGGDYYQAWLKDDAGTLVAIGTFSSSDEQVTLWSGVSPDRFPLVTVTIEAADGDQSSSGRVVLAGELRER